MALRKRGTMTIKHRARATARKLLLGLMMVSLFSGTAIAKENPIGGFFKRLGRSLSKLGKPQPARHRSGQKGSKRTTSKGPTAQPKQIGPSAAELAADSSSPTPAFAPRVRAASAAPSIKGRKRDSPFGIPVPGKQGFVTSPFSPSGNYVDVRAFPPGTEVKDPYTGKVFRVP